VAFGNTLAKSSSLQNLTEKENILLKEQQSEDR
jgi:hypothetical protein